MKVRSKQNPFVNSMISTSEQSNPDGILVNDLFDIVPVKEQSPEEATEADSFTVIIGSAGNRHWCRIVCQKRNFSMQNALERLQKEFGYRTRRFGDWGFRYTSMGSLPNKVLARARVRPGRAVGQITELGGTCPYLVYISVLFNSNGVWGRQVGVEASLTYYVTTRNLRQQKLLLNCLDVMLKLLIANLYHWRIYIEKSRGPPPTKTLGKLPSLINQTIPMCPSISLLSLYMYMI